MDFFQIRFMEDNPINSPEFLSDERFSMSEKPEAVAKAPQGNLSAAGVLPQRYVVKEIRGKKVLTCLEAPNLTVVIQRGLTVSAATARKSPQGTIFLDGVAQSEPFMDH